MKTDYIGRFEVPDGYFGEKAIIHLVYDQGCGNCIEVHETGYFRSCIPLATNKNEAIWLMNNHPSCKDRFKVKR